MSEGRDNVEPKVDPRTELFVRIVVAKQLEPIKDFMKNLDGKMDQLVNAETARSAREAVIEKLEERQIKHKDLSWKKIAAMIACTGIVVGIIVHFLP